MDIIEYAEKVCGRELMEYEKRMLRVYSKLPKSAVVVMTRRGPIWLDKETGKRVLISKE